jgi:hypothetical protein
MWPSIGQGHAKQSVVHVLGGAVSRPMGAVNLAPRSNGHERRGMSGGSPGPRRDVTGWRSRRRSAERPPALHGRRPAVPGPSRRALDLGRTFHLKCRPVGRLID